MQDRDTLKGLADDLQELEYAHAREDLNVYAGLLIPQQVETDEVDGKIVVPNQKDIAHRYIPAEHHRIINARLMDLEAGREVDGRALDRLMILAPPGSAKSTYASVVFPAWFSGRNPTKDIIAGSQTQDLADRFGRRVRNIVGGQIHRDVFRNGLARDQRAAGAWTTEKGGEYKAVGVAPFAGRRADIAALDDLIRGKKDADSLTVRDTTWGWLVNDLYPRLKPNAKIVYITTRWHQDDPAGRLLPKKWNGESGWFKGDDGEWWYVLSFVAIVETSQEAENDPLKRKIGEIIWPQWFTLKMLNGMRRKMLARDWNAMYQQKPREDTGGILKRVFWRKWTEEKMPKCEMVITVYDTAMEEGRENDYSARTTWGIFWHEDPPEVATLPRKIWEKPPLGGRHCCIILDAWQEQIDFPALRKEAHRHYNAVRPDRVLIEKKVSGISLIQEMRRIGVPASGVKAAESKKIRAHAAAVVLEGGCVYYPDRRWADEVIDRCSRASFVKGDPGNDMADTVVHAWNYFRKTFQLYTKDEDEEDDDQDEEPRNARSLYG